MWAVALAIVAGVAYSLPVRFPSPEGTLVVSKVSNPADPSRRWGLWLEEDDGSSLLVSRHRRKLDAVRAGLAY